MNDSIPESESAGVEVDLHVYLFIKKIYFSESQYPNVCLCVCRLGIHTQRYKSTHISAT